MVDVYCYCSACLWLINVIRLPTLLELLFLLVRPLFPDLLLDVRPVLANLVLLLLLDPLIFPVRLERLLTRKLAAFIAVSVEPAPGKIGVVRDLDFLIRMHTLKIMCKMVQINNRGFYYWYFALICQEVFQPIMQHTLKQTVGRGRLKPLGSGPERTLHSNQRKSGHHQTLTKWFTTVPLLLALVDWSASKDAMLWYIHHNLVVNLIWNNI